MPLVQSSHEVLGKAQLWCYQGKGWSFDMAITTNVDIRCGGVFSSIIIAFWSLLWKDIFREPEAECHTDLWLCASQKKKPPPLPVVQVPYSNHLVKTHQVQSVEMKNAPFGRFKRIQWSISLSSSVSCYRHHLKEVIENTVWVLERRFTGWNIESNSWNNRNV